MHILYYVSILAFSVLAVRAALKFRKVMDNGLGHEEIILACVMILAALNISMDLLFLTKECVGFVKVYEHMSFGSKVFQALLSYTTIHYITQTYSLRIVTKGEPK